MKNERKLVLSSRCQRQLKKVSLCRKLINYKLRSLKCDLNDIKVELSQARAKETRSIAMIATRRAKCAM